MRLLARLTTFFGLALLYGCVATVAAQGAAVGKLWMAGALTRAKLHKYAAVLYGHDLSERPAAEDTEPSAPEPPARVSRQQMLAERVQANPGIQARLAAINQSANDIRNLVQQLSVKRERYEIVKRGFYDLLQQLEEQTSRTALDEVRHTLEVLRPKQAKDLVIAMLEDHELNPSEGTLDNVLAILRGMPQDKLKRIFGEFKTDAERQKLHAILVAIGELDGKVAGP